MPTTVGTLLIKIGSEFDERGFTAAEGRTKSFGGELAKGAALVGTLGAALLAAGGAAVKMAADMEQTETAFTAMLGSAEAARAVLGELQQFAASTPFQFPELAEAAKSLAAFGFDASEIVPTMKQLGEVAAGLNIPMSEMAFLFGTTRVEGRLFAKDFRQFTSRGIPLAEALAEHLGVATSEISNMVTEGKIGFPEVQAAFAIMTSEGGKFAGQLEAQSMTLHGLYSTLRDNVTVALIEIGTAISENLDLKGILKDSISLIQAFTKRIVAFVKAHPELVKTGAAFAVLGTAVGAAAIAFGTLWAASGPIGLALVAISLVVADLAVNWERRMAQMTIAFSAWGLLVIDGMLEIVDVLGKASAGLVALGIVQAESLAPLAEILNQLGQGSDRLANAANKAWKELREMEPAADDAAGGAQALKNVMDLNMAENIQAVADALGGEGGAADALGEVADEFERIENLEKAPIKLGVEIDPDEKVALEDVEFTLRELTEGSPHEAEAKVEVPSATTTAITKLRDQIAGDGPGSIKYALATDLAAASGLVFETGIPGQIGRLIDGAIADLIRALAVDLINAVVGSGGLSSIAGAFRSVFGSGGEVTTAIEETTAAVGEQTTAVAGLNVELAAAAAAALVTAGAVAEILKGWITVIEAGFPIGGPGPGTEGPPSTQDPTDPTTGLGQAVNAAVQAAIEAGVPTPGALLAFLEGTLTAEQWRAFVNSFATPQDMLDWAAEQLGATGGAQFGVLSSLGSVAVPRLPRTVAPASPAASFVGGPTRPSWNVYIGAHQLAPEFIEFMEN